MTREEMIEAIIADVDNWDLDNLIGWIQHEMRAKLNSSTTGDITDEYYMVTNR